MFPKDIFEEIIFKIYDPYTFYNCYLVNKLFNSICNKLTDIKKEEFKKQLINNNHKYYILPNGWKHGLFQQFYYNKQLHIQSLYINDKKEGLYQKWYLNDIHQLWIKCNYINNKLNGLYQSWYSNGQLKIECIYNNNNKHGSYKEWYPNGQLWINCYYNNNNLDGIYQSWSKTGHLKFQYNYLNNFGIDIDGLTQYYYKNGKVYIDPNHKNLKKHLFFT